MERPSCTRSSSRGGKARKHARRCLMTYHFTKRLQVPFETAIVQVTEALKQRGFGILTEIDVRQTLRKKLDVDFRPYRILRACNPPITLQGSIVPIFSSAWSA